MAIIGWFSIQHIDENIESLKRRIKEIKNDREYWGTKTGYLELIKWKESLEYHQNLRIKIKKEQEGITINKPKKELLQEEGWKIIIKQISLYEQLRDNTIEIIDNAKACGAKKKNINAMLEKYEYFRMIAEELRDQAIRSGIIKE